MRRRFMLLVCGFLLLTVLLPFQAAAAESGSETLLYRFNGTILDFDQNRILWKQTGDKVLWLYNRKDGSQAKVHDATGSDYIIGWSTALESYYGRQTLPAKLSAEGVVYTLWSTNGSGDFITYYWKDGAVRQIGEKQQFLNEVKGNFAVLRSNVVDLTTGEYRSLPNSNFENGRNRFDLSADGMVVYTSQTNQSNLYKSLPDGTLTTYVPPSPNYYTYSGALTDGKNIIYKVLMLYNGGYKWSLRVRSADDKVTTLAINPFYSDFFSDPRATYQINNGWIAYQEYNLEKDNWTLYLRSPKGETKPIFETPENTWKQSWYNRDGLAINQLGADGSLVYTVSSGSYTNTKTYLYSAQVNKHVPVSGSGKFEYREHVFSGPEGGEYQYGAWFRIEGGSLYAIRI
ncbi:hypothetical protein [Paenibacillus alkalitolerans]|uniref:hypothetical protein n=1 Tax=Paenibacillus alkalitolerans TaxID=2799335 RepID=UPI0018F7B2B3|nr:hypothetical protein [Paenibacillus alkalitolerans]